MPNGTYGGVRGRKTKVGRKLLRFPPTRFLRGLEGGAFPSARDGVRHLRQMGSDICGRWGLPSRADVLGGLGQMSEGICCRWERVSPADVGARLLERGEGGCWRCLWRFIFEISWFFLWIFQLSFLTLRHSEWDSAESSIGWTY